MFPVHRAALQLATAARQRGQHAQIRALATYLVGLDKHQIDQMRAAARTLDIELSTGTACLSTDTSTLRVPTKVITTSATTAHLRGAPPSTAPSLTQ